MSDKEELKEIDEDGKKKKVCDSRRVRKAKQIVSSPFRKAKKLYRKKKSSSETPGKGCYLCFMRPITTDSDAPEDPNTRELTYEFLKSLIEKNDFYSRECNPHINLDS
ncbi:hypothetical protein MRB53_027813 [Persea americana]|uniref:Uncharacterized protein n=1 Tax=Persea americana TaxID=3435 RepID=A0ACC2KDP7_PERAE|nr:hypothetical protein MRB53_027813 [Persea americana]